MAFWRNLKEGYDHFEVTHLEPKVDVCNRKYVFDAHPVTAESTTFNAQGACPEYKLPDEIADAVTAKQKADEAEFKVQVAALDAQERAAADAELAMKMEAAKPKKPPVDLLASIMPKSPTPTAGPVATGAVSVADAKPINVPIPKPSPLAVSRPEIASGYDATEKPHEADVIGNFLSYVKVPDFGKKDEAPQSAQPPVQQAVAAPVTAVPTPSEPTKPKASVAPAAVATPKPVAASAPAPAPVAAPPASSTATAEAPWWKKLNPFGG